MQREHDPTTHDLVRGAVAELAAVGQAEFTMDGVAQRSFYSPGALYERWPDRAALLADIGQDPVGRELGAALEHATDASDALTWALDSGRPHLTLVSEILLAGHTMPEVAPVSQALWTQLIDGLRRLMPESMAWLTGTYAVGNSLLDVIGLPGPTRTTGRVPWLAEACSPQIADGVQPEPPPVREVSGTPEAPTPLRGDSTTHALITAARDILSQEGAPGVSMRRVSASAGVTTGAIYRRYPGRAALLADVLVTELPPERYAWTEDLVNAFATDNPFLAAADVMTRRLLATAGDDPSQQVLIQLGVAARNDPELRAQVQERILSAHQARCPMFERLTEVGLLRQDVDPEVFAWGFQVIPVGMRVTRRLGIPVDEQLVRDALRRVLMASAQR